MASDTLADCFILLYCFVTRLAASSILEKQPDGLSVAPVGATTEDPNREADFSHIPFHDDSDYEEEAGPPGAAASGPRDDSLL
jgi:hypothetical protein